MPAEPCLDVEATERFLDVPDAGLHLHDQHGARGWMPGQQVTSTPVAVMIEAHLWLGKPAGSAEALSRPGLHRGVITIDEPIKVGPVPSHFHHESRVDSLCHACKRHERQSPDPSRLRPGNGTA